MFRHLSLWYWLPSFSHPDQEDRRVDIRQRKRTVPMKVLALGLGCTGTAS